MAVMKAVQISRPNGSLELVEREIPEPRSGQIRIKVEACGVCHGEVMALQGHHPGMQYPRIPGHEVVGVIDSLGDDVTDWAIGERVGIGWSGGNREITGLTYDGGYAEYMVAAAVGVVKLPKDVSAAEIAPLMCAGVTTFSALSHSNAKMGDVVAIQGIGGLGHLAIQYARRAGFHTVAISRGSEKKDLAISLGAHRYIDSATEDAVQILKEMGGAKVILGTAPNGKAISQLFEGLAPYGEFIIVAGSADALELTPGQFLNGRRTLKGWTGAGGKELEDTLRFSFLDHVRPMIETYPLEQAAAAFESMMSAKVKFRAVLTMSV